MHTVTAITDDNKIYEKIEFLYKEKPNFIYHLLRSFFPNKKSRRVLDLKAEKLTNKRCCISDHTIIDIKGASILLSKKDGVSFETIFNTISDNKIMIQQIEADLVFDGRKIAIVGENTDKMLCLQAFTQFNQFLKNKYISKEPPFVKMIYHEFIKYYSDEIKNRFDLNIKWYKLSHDRQKEFTDFLHERTIPGIKLSSSYIWEMVSGRKQYNPNKNEHKANKRRSSKPRNTSSFSKR